jgi:hypothetical protein
MDKAIISVLLVLIVLCVYGCIESVKSEMAFDKQCRLRGGVSMHNTVGGRICVKREQVIRI